MDTLQWSLPEYEEKEHSSNWFWSLGIIVVCGSIASIIYGNYFFAVLLILGGLLLGFFATKRPPVISYELGQRGLRIGNRLFPYETIKSFYIETEIKPVLLVHSERFFMPIISIPIEEEMAEDIYYILLSKNVSEETIKPHSSETIMDSLGF